MSPQAPKITPPFAWAGRHLTPIALTAIVAVGAFMRIFQLTSLPPGLSTAAAILGNQARALIEHHTWPALAAANYYSPLWVLLQTLSVQLFGHTQLALLVWPAALGTLAIITTWLWAKCWINRTVAWLAAFLMAVTPWAISLSRVSSPFAMYPLLVTLTLWLAARYWRTRTKTIAMVIGVVLILNALAGPIGWLTDMLVCIAAAYLYLGNRRKLDRQSSTIYLIIGGLLAFAVLLYTALLARHNLAYAVHDLGLVASIPQLGGTIVAAVLMFNAVGDPNYIHNLAGSPELNSFAGLMLIAGILVAISRLHERRYRMFLLCWVVLLIPTLVTDVGAPDSFTAAAALPLTIGLAAIGISLHA